ncbi:diguanylate cyclase [Rhizobium tubonense]|uniref:Diguanylate cyclase n=1 Tax=Rhizobium tubonense TaxID=484088 RepID=A0A2W4D7J2_9HYPH|nr:PAS domain-containing protein [Rhizobium tubonense]PZM13224.1 diguanylate cyclase [Rhizobium tubonense]
MLALFHAFSTKCALMRRAVNTGDDELAYALDRELGPLFTAIIEYRASSALEIYMQLQFVSNIIRDEADDRASVIRNAQALSVLIDRYFAGSSAPASDSLVVLPALKTDPDAEEFDRGRLLNDTILDSLPDRVVVVTRDYRYLYSNAANGEYRKMKPIELIGRHVKEFIGSEFFEQTAKQKLDACFAGENIDHVFRDDMTETSGMALRCRMTPLRDDKGGIFAALLTLQDVNAKTNALVG